MPPHSGYDLRQVWTPIQLFQSHVFLNMDNTYFSSVGRFLSSCSSNFRLAYLSADAKKTYYEILELPRNASKKEIRDAFVELSMKVSKPSSF